MLENILKTNIIAALIILLTLFISHFIKNKYSVRWKYIIWLFTAIFLLLPVNLIFYKPIAEIRLPQGIYNLSSNTSDNTSDNLTSDSELSETGSADADGQNNKILLRTADILNILCVIWIIGILYFGIYTLIRYRIVKKNLTEFKKEHVYPLTKKIYKNVCFKLNIQQPPILYTHSKLSTPVLSGLLSPALYLPDTYYGPDELELIFAHELNHYKHKDLLYKTLLLITKTIYWFNPALNLMFREADRDLEAICDSNVIAFADNADLRKTYGKLLLKTVSSERSAFNPTAGLNDGVTKFKERMGYMLSAANLKRGIPFAILICLLLTASNIFVGCSIDTRSKAEAPIPSSDSQIFESSTQNSPDSSLSVQLSPDIADATVTEDLTPVSTEYQIYTGTYWYENRGASFSLPGIYDNAERQNIYAIRVLSTEETAFTFSLLNITGEDPENRIEEAVIENGTAVFVGDGTTARYKDEAYDLTFTFPNDYRSLPVVTEIEIIGFAPTSGLTFSRGDIPGYEFG